MNSKQAREITNQNMSKEAQSQYEWIVQLIKDAANGGFACVGILSPELLPEVQTRLTFEGFGISKDYQKITDSFETNIRW